MFPEVIHNFNVYRAGNVLVGVSGEVTLPDLSSTTEAISGAGILGSIDTPIIGHFDNMDQEIPFRVLHEDMFKLADPTVNQELTLRGTVQVSDEVTGAIDAASMRIVYRGKMKSFKGGTLKAGGLMDASVTLGISYMLIELDGKKKLELDKLNGIYKVNGKDILEKFRRYM